MAEQHTMNDQNNQQIISTLQELELAAFDGRIESIFISANLGEISKGLVIGKGTDISMSLSGMIEQDPDILDIFKKAVAISVLKKML